MLSLPAALLLALVLLGLWLLSLAIRDASIVDIFWGPGFAIVAWVCAYEQGFELGQGQWLLLSLVSLWAARLGLYLAWRNLGHGEDRRYQAMRKRAGERFWLWSLYAIFGLQGSLLFLISSPVQTALLGTSADAFAPLAYVGLALWVVGFAFESIGDAQLARFKAKPENAGKVMDRGLWAWTRHPNYFGDFMIWWGHFVIARSLGAPWWTAVGPVVMSILLMRVSGVPMLERGMAKRRPAYADYIARTSPFFPRPPKTNLSTDEAV